MSPAPPAALVHAFETIAQLQAQLAAAGNNPLNVPAAALPPSWQSWLMVAAGVVAAASVAAKVLELVVRALSFVWPEASKADGWLGVAVAVLSRLQAAPVLQSLALSPAPGAPSHPLSTSSTPSLAIAPARK